MFVVPSARERGIGGNILADLEAWAIAAGMTRIVLETGDRQDAAIRLYERCGFVAIPCFGKYADSKSSRCFEKILVPDRR
jgi:GNAT superfamily N-acetyltransferase